MASSEAALDAGHPATHAAAWVARAAALDVALSAIDTDPKPADGLDLVELEVSGQPPSTADTQAKRVLIPRMAIVGVLGLVGGLCLLFGNAITVALNRRRAQQLQIEADRREKGGGKLYRSPSTDEKARVDRERNRREYLDSLPREAKLEAQMKSAKAPSRAGTEPTLIDESGTKDEPPKKGRISRRDDAAGARSQPRKQSRNLSELEGGEAVPNVEGDSDDESHASDEKTEMLSALLSYHSSDGEGEEKVNKSGRKGKSTYF